MLPEVRTALHQAVEEVVKEFDSSYEDTKRNNEALRGNNRLLMKRIKELNDELENHCAALQAEKDCSAVQEENKRLLGLTAQQKEENKVLHRKVNDLMLKLCQAYRKRDELAEKLRKAESEPEIFSTFNVHLMSGESAKIAELNKKVEDLQKKNDELIEQLKNRAILNSVLARKYEKLQITLNSDIGEVFECELDSRPFEKGYYLRIGKDDYELIQSDRAFIQVVGRGML